MTLIFWTFYHCFLFFSVEREYGIVLRHALVIVLTVSTNASVTQRIVGMVRIIIARMTRKVDVNSIERSPEAIRY